MCVFVFFGGRVGIRKLTSLKIKKIKNKNILIESESLDFYVAKNNFE